LANTCVFCLAVSGTSLVAGTFNNGAYLSTDNGKNWTAVNIGLTYADVYSLTVSGTNLFAGTYGGVFLSTNNGTSWTQAGLANTPVCPLSSQIRISLLGLILAASFFRPTTAQAGLLPAYQILMSIALPSQGRISLQEHISAESIFLLITVLAGHRSIPV